MRTFTSGFLVGLLAAAMTIAAVNLYRRVAPIPSAPAPIARELTGKKTETVAVTSVQAYPAATKKALGVPPALQAMADALLVGATQAKPSDRPQTITAVLDANTGATSLYIRSDPLPWFALERRVEAGVFYGFSNDGLPGYRANARYDFLQVKAAHIGVLGTADQNGHWFAGVGVTIRW